MRAPRVALVRVVVVLLAGNLIYVFLEVLVRGAVFFFRRRFGRGVASVGSLWRATDPRDSGKICKCGWALFLLNEQQ